MCRFQTPQPTVPSRQPNTPTNIRPKSKNRALHRDEGSFAAAGSTGGKGGVEWVECAAVEAMRFDVHSRLRHHRLAVEDCLSTGQLGMLSEKKPDAPAPADRRSLIMCASEVGMSSIHAAAAAAAGRPASSMCSCRAYSSGNLEVQSMDESTLKETGTP